MQSSYSIRAEIVDRLRRAGCVAAEEEADELLATTSSQADLEHRLNRREEGEPLAWIIGSTTFCGRPIHVDTGVYVPRPQTERLAHRAGSLLAAAGRKGRAADICTGAGAIAVHLRAAAPGAAVVATDVDWRATRCARSNGVAAVQADLGAALCAGIFDVVTAVAPYVPTDELRFLPSDVQRHEPALALDGGVGGLELVRRVIEWGAQLLRPGGWLLAEIGGDQDRAVARLLVANGFTRPATWRDDDGDLRGVQAQLER